MRRLDHHDADRDARDQPVAAREVAGARHVAERHFRDRGAALRQDVEQQILVLGRIDAVVAAGQHRDGAAGEAGAMRGLVDAARQTRDDDEAGGAEIARELAGEFQPGAGGVARADDRDHRPHQAASREPRMPSSGGASSIVARRGG